LYQVRYGAGMAASPEDAGRDVAAAAPPPPPPPPATPALPAGISAATVTVATVSVTTPPLRT